LKRPDRLLGRVQAVPCVVPVEHVGDTLGDSITDGVHSTADRSARWPDVLALWPHADRKTANIGVVNAGISGNRLMSTANPLVGHDALARFDRDVLGARYLFVLDGINDIDRAGKPQKPEDVIDKDTLIWALEQLALRAHSHELKIFAATLTPFRRGQSISQNTENR